MKTIKCVLREPECDKNGCSYHIDRIAELHYKDDRYEVYSYECGDGIWGTYWEEFGDMEKDLGKGIVDKWVEDGYEDMEIEVPFSFIEKQGYSILTKKGKPLRVSNKDIEHMCFDGVIELPDGSLTEPDGDNSPLRQMGMI